MNLYRVWPFWLFLISICVFLFWQTDLAARTIPVSTASEQALTDFLAARDCLEHREYDRARELLKDALREEPHFVQAHLALAQIGHTSSERMGALSTALSTIDQISLGEEHLAGYIAATIHDDFAERRHHLYDLLRLHPSDPRVHYLAGQFHLEEKEWGTALSHGLRAIELDPEFSPAFYLLGYAYIGNDDFDSAGEAFQSYLNLAPDRANAHYVFGEYLSATGAFAQARLYYEKALELDPRFHIALKGIGDTHLFQGKFIRAQEYYEQLLESAHTPREKTLALESTAISYLHQGNVPLALSAIEHFRTIAQSDSDYAHWIASYGMASLIYCETGNPKQGYAVARLAEDLVQYTPILPSQQLHLQIETLLWQSYALAQMGDLKKARATLSIYNEKMRDHKEQHHTHAYYLILGILESSQGNWSEAQKYLDLADSQDPLQMYYLAKVTEQAGEVEMAQLVRNRLEKHNINSMRLALARQKDRR